MHANWTLFLGRLHPLIVHLPIGFLFALAGLEVVVRVGRFRDVAAARGALLAVTAASAVAAVVAGLMLSTAGGYDRGLLFWHKWAGIALVTLTVAAAVAYATRHRRAYGTLLIATLAVLGPASHFGGSMTHGANYLTAYAPAWLRSAPSPATRPVTVALRDPSQAHLYADVVRPILVTNCVSCHGPERTSGLLRMDTIDGIKAGGNTGPGMVPSNPDASLIVHRMLLPTADSHHMPPGDQPQAGDDAVAAVRWWVTAGAADPVVADLHPTADQTALLGRLLHLSPPPATAVTSARPLADLTADLAAAQRAGFTCKPVAAGQPWVYCTAGSNRRAVGDVSLAALAPFAANVRSLNLAGTSVTDAGLVAVAAMANLAELHLERTRVTDAGLGHLSGLSNLAYLNLYGTDVSDAGLDALRPLSSLERLYVWQTRIDPAAVAAFERARADPLKVRAIERQIAELQEQIRRQHVDVVGGAVPTTRPIPAAVAARPGT